VRGWQLGKPRRTLARLDAWSRSGLRSPCVEVAREGTCRFRKVYPFSTWHSPGPERIVDHSQNQARVRVPGTAAQTRMVSVAGTRLEPRKSARPFKSPPQPGTSFLGRCVSCFTLGPADSLVSWRGHRAIGDGDCPFGRFLPTWPRWLPLAGPLSQWSSLHRHLAGGGPLLRCTDRTRSFSRPFRQLPAGIGDYSQSGGTKCPRPDCFGKRNASGSFRSPEIWKFREEIWPRPRRGRFLSFRMGADSGVMPPAIPR
jgi:hypothetical protein